MPALVIDNRIIPYELRYSARARRLHVKVKPGKIEVVAPFKTPKSAINNFVHESRHWIARKKKEMEGKRPLPRVIPLISGSKIPFQGSLVDLTVCEEGRGRTPVVSHAQGLRVTLPKYLIAETTNRETTIKKALKTWFIERLESEVARIADHYCEILGVRPTRIRFRRQKTRWGSCSTKGSINLNWHLVFLPQHILEYVVVHELCHLKYLNHSPHFWALVAGLIPDYKARIQWLKDYRPAFPAEFWD